MSALPPKADIAESDRDVRFVPKADLPMSRAPFGIFPASILSCGLMAEELTYKTEAAAGYDRAFAHITTHFVPFLLRAAHLAPGMRVLDIAAGTGLAAETALELVGPTGHVTAVAHRAAR